MYITRQQDLKKNTKNFNFFLVMLINWKKVSFICNALRDLLSSVQFLKRKKHPWKNVTFSKVAGFSIIPSWVVSTFLKLYKWYQIAQSISYQSPYLFTVESYKHFEIIYVIHTGKCFEKLAFLTTVSAGRKCFWKSCFGTKLTICLKFTYKLLATR